MTRDRGQNYRIGVTRGVPQAQQVADRWHLLKNLSEAVTRQMNGHGADLRQAAQELSAIDQPETGSTPSEETEPPKPHRRQALVDEVQRRATCGESRRHIAREMQLARGTVARYLQLSDPLPRRRNSPQVSSVTPYLNDLKRRWYDDGCQNINQLWRELKERGFEGSYMSVYRAIQHSQRTLTTVVKPIRIRTAVDLLTQPMTNLDADQQLTLQAICKANPLYNNCIILAKRCAR